MKKKQPLALFSFKITSKLPLILTKTIERHGYPSFFFLFAENNVKLRKKMIATSKRHVKHSLPGLNTQQLSFTTVVSVEKLTSYGYQHLILMIKIMPMHHNDGCNDISLIANLEFIKIRYSS